MTTDTNEIRVWGASDDLIETRGAVDEEYGASYNAADTVIVTSRDDAGADTEVRLRVEYGPDGGDVWAITEETSTGLVTIIPARGEEAGDDDEGCPGYSPKAVVRGGYAVRLDGQESDSDV